MANRKRLKGVKNNRRKSKAGHRNRAKRKKSVKEKCRLRLLKEKPNEKG